MSSREKGHIFAAKTIEERRGLQGTGRESPGYNPPKHHEPDSTTTTLKSRNMSRTIDYSIHTVCKRKK
jgi:hypothetical protein